MGACYDRALHSRRQYLDPDGYGNQRVTISLLTSWAALKEETGEIEEAIDTLGYSLNLQVEKIKRRGGTKSGGGGGVVRGFHKEDASKNW